MHEISNEDWELLAATDSRKWCVELSHADDYRTLHNYHGDLPPFCGDCGGKVYLGG